MGDAEGGAAEVMDIETVTVLGFMDTPIPVTKLDDGAVKFWIPWFEWVRVRDELSRAIEAHPEYMDAL